MKLPISFFESVRLTYSCDATVLPLLAVSWRARSISALKITRPDVVRMSSPFQRYSIGC